MTRTTIPAAIQKTKPLRRAEPSDLRSHGSRRPARPLRLRSSPLAIRRANRSPASVTETMLYAGTQALFFLPCPASLASAQWQRLTCGCLEDTGSLRRGRTPSSRKSSTRRRRLPRASPKTGASLGPNFIAGLIKDAYPPCSKGPPQRRQKRSVTGLRPAGAISRQRSPLASSVLACQGCPGSYPGGTRTRPNIGPAWGPAKKP